jgi:hypothetical protein
MIAVLFATLALAVPITQPVHSPPPPGTRTPCPTIYTCPLSHGPKTTRTIDCPGLTGKAVISCWLSHPSRHNLPTAP